MADSMQQLIARVVSLLRKGRACHDPENLQHWGVAKATKLQCDANCIPIVAECASSTPLETLTPDVIFIPNEIVILDRLHVSHQSQET